MTEYEHLVKRVLYNTTNSHSNFNYLLISNKKNDTAYSDILGYDPSSYFSQC